MTPNQCPICHSPTEEFRREFDRDLYHVVCRKCGRFSITGEAAEYLDHHTNQRQSIHLLAGVVRWRSESGDPVLIRTTNVAELLASARPPKSLIEAVDELLRYLRTKSTNPADFVKLEPANDFPLFFGRSASDFTTYLREARGMGYVEWPTGEQVRLTSAGWERLDKVDREVRRAGAFLSDDPRWVRVDRALVAVEERLNTAENEEDFQTVGLLCREAMISLAQAVYDPARHPTLDGVTPSSTDAKRMLDAYTTVVLSGSSNEEVRRLARATVDLANAVQHSRTGLRRDAEIAAEATRCAAKLLGIIESYSITEKLNQ